MGSRLWRCQKRKIMRQGVQQLKRDYPAVKVPKIRSQSFSISIASSVRAVGVNDRRLFDMPLSDFNIGDYVQVDDYRCDLNGKAVCAAAVFVRVIGKNEKKIQLSKPRTGKIVVRGGALHIETSPDLH
jgi:hypothetical protein